MYGLAVVNGDLVLSGNDYYKIAGAAKVKQDMTFALNDEYGSDPFHPYWGSTLSRFIGEPITDGLRQAVVAEVTRVLNNYIAVQTDMASAATARGTRGLMTTDNVVTGVQSIDVRVNFDSIDIQVTLSTMAGNSVQISRQVTA